MAVTSTRIYLVLLVLYSASAPDDSNAESAPTQSRTFGGHPCGKDEKDGIVHLRNDTVYNCGASMINKLWGLTAAHCVYNESNKNLVVELITSERISIKKIYVHPQYKPPNVANDIAMIYLSSPIPGGKMNYVELPSKDEQVCSSPLLKGWGLTENVISSRTLLCVNLLHFESSKCRERYGFTYPYTKTIICTLSAEGKDSCGGDSGGPLTCGKVLVGIVSWDLADCADPYSPGVYTKVSYFMDFIDDTMGNKRKSGVGTNGSHFKIVLGSLLFLLTVIYCL